MRFSYLGSFLLLALLLLCCRPDGGEANLEVDHFNIWVENPQVAKDQLQQIGFTAVPDSLSLVHAGQGTTGRYFYFLNTYLELIFVYDETEFAANAGSNPELDFEERSRNAENGFSPFSVALRMTDYAPDRLPFQTVAYKQDWMSPGSSIYVAQNSKYKPAEPSLFVVFPEIQYDTFDSMADLSQIQEEYALWRSFYRHPNGAEKVTKLKITSPSLDRTSETIRALEGIETVELAVGETYLLELYFDQQRKGEEYDLRPVLPLKVYL